MESIINKSLLIFLNEHKILNKNQFGFQKDKSCTLQLLQAFNTWSNLLDLGKTVDVVCLDFEKAFDSVIHSKLTAKLRFLGIRGFLLTCMESFLNNRTQAVKVNNTLSKCVSVISGVPQGSVLGPTLFILYINDIFDVVKHSNVLLFADDLKIFKTFQAIFYFYKRI